MRQMEDVNQCLNYRLRAPRLIRQESVWAWNRSGSKREDKIPSSAATKLYISAHRQ